MRAVEGHRAHAPGAERGGDAAHRHPLAGSRRTLQFEPALNEGGGDLSCVAAALWYGRYLSVDLLKRQAHLVAAGAVRESTGVREIGRALTFQVATSASLKNLFDLRAPLRTHRPSSPSSRGQRR